MDLVHLFSESHLPIFKTRAVFNDYNIDDNCMIISIEESTYSILSEHEDELPSGINDFDVLVLGETYKKIAENKNAMSIFNEILHIEDLNIGIMNLTLKGCLEESARLCSIVIPYVADKIKFTKTSLIAGIEMTYLLQAEQLLYMKMMAIMMAIKKTGVLL